MRPKVLAVIPARMAASRFPGKPLALISGKMLIQHLYEEASKSNLINKVIIATDSSQVAGAAENFGAEVMMTSNSHKTGSDRAAEALEKYKSDIVINIQADHIGVKAINYTRIVREMLDDRTIRYATIAKKVESESYLYSPHRVKLVFDKNDNALWFTRYPIPYLQGVKKDPLSKFDYYYHIGVYFFRKKALQNFHAWKQSPLEKAESLEQLRILENGGKIKVYKIKNKIISIDTPKDIKLAKMRL